MLNTPRRLAFFLPNSFTALNLACGFYSILLGWRGEFYIASMLLILGAIFDSVDGRVARLTGTQSSFGEQFDSISDVITFGAAPAFLVYQKFFTTLGRLGLVVSFVFLLCGALRLARFNANIDKVSSDFFQGLPIPSGALALVGLVLASLDYNFINLYYWLPVFYVLFFSFLMISSIPFNSFKKSDWVKRHKKRVLFNMFCLMILTLLEERIMIGLIINIYVLSSLIYFFIHHGELKNMFDWKSEYDEETGEHQ